jgi:hypothetical protein
MIPPIELIAEIEKLYHALSESVRLQAHYAELLNMYDGGERIVFKTAKEFLNRLDELEKNK